MIDDADNREKHSRAGDDYWWRIYFE
jgi:hypothetical protein